MRSLRLLRGARVREERLTSARQNVRSLELQWRLKHFQTLISSQRDSDIYRSIWLYGYYMAMYKDLYSLLYGYIYGYMILYV